MINFMAYAVEVFNVSKFYRKRSSGFVNGMKSLFFPELVPTLNDVSFRVKRGEIFGLLGPNGAGKTTLLKIITGLLRPDKGRVRIFGEDVTKNFSKISGKINAVFARANLWWELTGKENLMVYGKLYGVEDLEEKVEKLLDLFGLEDKADTYTDLYSTGEIMRLSLAKAVINDPDVLILDEPTIGLDPNMTLKVREFLKDLNKNKKTTILLSTHYMEEADILCDRVALIDGGRIIKIDSPENFKRMIKKQDIVEIRVREFSSRMVEKLRSEEFVKSAYFLEEVGRLRVVIDDLRNLDRLIEKVKKFTEIENVVTALPTLEDVFIQFTGKTLKGGEV